MPTSLAGPTTLDGSTSLSSTILAYIPSPPQGVWYIGPLPLRAYALCIIVGIIVAVWWGNRRWKARGGQDGEVLDVAIWAVPFGLIGGRLYHLATDWRTYFGDGPKTPIDAVKIWDGGLGIWGAVLLGALGAWIGCRRHGIKLPPFGDALAPPILLAQAIGRLGNYFNQELYGRPTDLPWGLKIYERVDAAGNADPGLIAGVSNGHVVTIVHPTFLYELLWNLFVVVLLVVVDRYFRIGHGRLFALYVAGYCVGRFGVELMRSDPATHIFGVRINVFTAIIVFACAAVYFVVAPKGREQGLTMYHPARAEELAEAGVVGYVDPYGDEEYDEEYGDEDVEGFYLNDDAEPDDEYDDGDYGDEVHDEEADDESELVDLQGHHVEAATVAAGDGVGETEVGETAAADAEVADAEVADAEVADAEVADAEVADAEVADAEVADAEVADAEVADTEVADTEVADTEVADTEVADTEVADTEVADTEVADTEVADTGTPDTTADDPDEVSEGLAEAAEDRADDEGDRDAAGTDEDEPALADGQSTDAGGPAEIVDDDPDLDGEIIEGTDETADGKPWTPTDS
ncbi:prolipoprotein diacylglyceryl transferase [Gordonia sp. NPDC003424]